jgi:hypothetical protein
LNSPNSEPSVGSAKKHVDLSRAAGFLMIINAFITVFSFYFLLGVAVQYRNFLFLILFLLFASVTSLLSAKSGFSFLKKKHSLSALASVFFVILFGLMLCFFGSILIGLPVIVISILAVIFRAVSKKNLAD